MDHETSKIRAAKDHGKTFQSKLAASFSVIVHWDLPPPCILQKCVITIYLPDYLVRIMNYEARFFLMLQIKLLRAVRKREGFVFPERTQCIIAYHFSSKQDFLTRSKYTLFGTWF